MNENLMRQEKHKFTGQLVAQLEKPIGLKNLIAGEWCATTSASDGSCFVVWGNPGKAHSI